jgi:hypothetical protein
MLHVALAGYGPRRQAHVQSLLASVGSNSILASFTAAGAGWAQNRLRWPFLSVLLRRRVLKREPMYRQATSLTETLK